MMNNKEILQLKAENEAMKTMIKNIRESVGKVNGKTEAGRLFFVFGEIKYFSSEEAFELWRDNTLSQLEQVERNEESDGNKQESSGT